MLLASNIAGKESADAEGAVAGLVALFSAAF
jgi:hypothetical protein